NFIFSEGEALGKSNKDNKYLKEPFRLINYTYGVQEALNKVSEEDTELEEIFGKPKPVESQPTEQPDIFLEGIENLTKQESQITEDKFKYYGSFYDIKLENGK